MTKGFRYALGATSVFILLAFAIACGGGGETTKSYKVKDEFKVGKGTWKILSVEITRELQRKEGVGKFTAEGMFVVIEIEMKNEGNETANVTGDEVEIMDQNRNSYAFDSKNNNVYLNAVGKESFTKAPAEVGKSIKGFLIFDVSKDAKDLRAKVKDIDIRSRDYVYVDLNS